VEVREQSGEPTPLRVLALDAPGPAGRLLEGVRGGGHPPGLRVEFCTSAAALLQRFWRAGAEAALVPVASGDEGSLAALRQLRLHARSLALVAVRDPADGAIVAEATRRGAGAVLLPSELEAGELARCVRHAVERHRMLCELEEARERERHLATHDPVTELPNRLLFSDRLGQAVAAARRRGDRLAVLVMDLDEFKAVNDTLGHAAGDRLLAELGARLVSCIRRSDTAARLGGDEFGVLITHLRDETAAARVAEKIVAELARPIDLDGREYVASVAIGIALHPRDGSTPEDLIKNADAAMFNAKESGGGRYVFFAQEMNTRAEERLSLESRLRLALARQELRLHYQPQVDVDTGRIAGAEALLRWQNPELGLVPPAGFLPLAEDTRLIVPIGAFVLHEACAQARRYDAHGFAGCRIAVNVSGHQVHEGNLVRLVSEALEESGLSPDRLELELTESALLRDVDAIIDTLDGLKGLGVRLALDDFGTGYSGLAYLKRLPLDVLKIDRLFVRGMAQDPADETLTAAIVAIAEGLGLEHVAEGVETTEQLERLRALGCRRMQGFLFSPPVEAEAFVALLCAAKRDGLGRGGAAG